MPHDHNFILDDGHLRHNERQITFVVILTSVTMLVEIVAGYLTGSMGLLADGWHMASHAGALGMSVIVYKMAKSKKIGEKFSFGAGKLIPLGGYSSALILGMVAMLMVVESVRRLFMPRSIEFSEAIWIATIGLVVNVASMVLLREEKSQTGDGSGHHHHGHDSHFYPEHHSHDDNMRGAYLHVLADALTSVLAITGLIIGKMYQIFWVDSLMGIAGAILIFRWSVQLGQSTGWQLLDGHAKNIDQEQIRKLIETDQTKILDLHIWRIAPSAFACEMVVEGRQMRGADYYKNILEPFSIKHLTVEEKVG
jgi:cation diffusion facilitator family transporter